MFPLPEKITVWTRVSSDGLGGGNWSAPAVYDARIAYAQQKFTDINGDQSVSTSVCYTTGDILRDEIARGVYVLFGESAAVEPLAEADDVRAISHIPSGSGDLKKLWFS